MEINNKNKKNYIFLKKNYIKIYKDLENDIKKKQKQNIKLKIQVLQIILKKMNKELNKID